MSEKEGKEVTVADIVKAYLEKNGFDGLFCPIVSCGCSLQDLFHCVAEGVEQCKPGYFGVVAPEDKDEYAYRIQADLPAF